MSEPLLLATSRKGKVKEVKAVLKELELTLDLVTLDQLDQAKELAKETGRTFKENALIKARFWAEKSQLASLADDSGLIVDALPGQLGVKTKRFHSGTDQQRNQKLLQALAGRPKNQRTARFVTAIALFDPQNQTSQISQAECSGWIGNQPQGNQGFGFDPIFMVEQFNQSFGQLSLSQKNQISARAKALRKMANQLKQYQAIG